MFTPQFAIPAAALMAYVPLPTRVPTPQAGLGRPATHQVRIWIIIGIEMMDARANE